MLNLMIWTKFLAVIWIFSISVVSYFSLAPRIEFPLDFQKADLVYHFVAYLWLSILPFYSFQQGKTALACALLMLPLGMGLEIAQFAVPGRVFSFMDVGANSAGVVFGLVCSRFLNLSLYFNSKRASR
jgi:VanZ family protein